MVSLIPRGATSLARVSVRLDLISPLRSGLPNHQVGRQNLRNGQATTGLNIMTDLITANPNLREVFASNLIMAQGAGQAIAENKVADKNKSGRIRLR
jgi:ribose transport system substrate-binding protein